MDSGNKIPKIIHCCWLSGDPLPPLYKQCVDSWKQCMPDYEILLWDMKRFPVDEVLFVRQACDARKWAYAADYIRLYALYHYGGIYLDMDVMVYRSFDPFLVHSAFSSIEFNPRIFYESLKKKEANGIGIEAAVIGAEKGHHWIKNILDFYQDKEFINDPKYYWSIIMPRVMLKITVEQYGFKYIPLYQVLDGDIHLYPPDVFSTCYDLAIIKKTNDDIPALGEDNKIRYSLHLCAHSWYEFEDKKSWGQSVKKIVLKILGKKNTDKIKRAFKTKELADTI